MEKNNKKQLENRKRTLSRLVAVQIFYQFDFFEKTKEIHEIKNNLIDNYVLFEEDEEKSYRKKIDEILLDNLINAMISEAEELDKEIVVLQRKSQQNDDVIKQILRFGSLELKLAKDIDAKVIINEYVDIAAYFFDDSKLSFVNSVLNNLAKKYRESEEK